MPIRNRVSVLPSAELRTRILRAGFVERRSRWDDGMHACVDEENGRAERERKVCRSRCS